VREASSRDASRAGAISYAVWFLFAPLWALMGVNDLALSAITWFGVAALVVVQLGGLYWQKWLKYDWLANALLSSLVIALLSRMFGPLVLVPVIAAANTNACALQPLAWQRWITISLGGAAVLLPMLLEWGGVLPSSYLFRDGMMCIVPQVTNLPATASLAFLGIASAGAVIISSLYVSRVRGALNAAEERYHVYAWHLRHLVKRG
jgi:hypothetical protein